MDNNLNKISKIKDINNPLNSTNQTANTAKRKRKPSKMLDEPQTASSSSSSNQSPKLPSFYCAQCSYCSIWKQAVERHQLKHFKKELDENGAKTNKFHCDPCAYTTENTKEFTVHLRGHSQSNQNKELVEDKYPPKTKDIRKQKCNFKSKQSSKNQNITKKPKRPYNRGKYANVSIKTTKDGFFQCEYCTYQTAIRSAVVVHQIRHQEKESC